MIAVQVARRYVRQKRSSIMEIQVVLRQHAAAEVVDNMSRTQLMSDEQSTIDSEEPAKEDEIKNQLEECRKVVEKQPFVVRTSDGSNSIGKSIRKQIEWYKEHPEE